MALQTSASSERQILAAKERRKRDDEVTADIIRAMMANPEGRRWLWNQMAECGVFLSATSLDPQTLAFAAGKRSLGLKLFSDIGLYAARLLPTMLEENSSTISKDTSDGRSADD